MIDLREFNPTQQLIIEKTELNRSMMPVIDSHIHLCGRYRHEQFWEKYEIGDVVNQLKDLGIIHIIDLELYSRKHWNYVRNIIEKYREFISMCAPIDFEEYEEGFQQRILGDMQFYARDGACGFKIWKSLGLTVRKKDGVLLRLDDPSIKFIWEEAANMKLPIVIHVGDPPAFFQNPDCHNERVLELIDNPKWNYSNNENITYECLMEQLEELLKNNPETVFVVAHMASSAHDLNLVDKLLTCNRNLYVDIAATLSELGRQPRKFRRLVNKHYKRILFGTDYFAGDVLSHIPYFRFLETEDEYFSYSVDGRFSQGCWNIYGCGLEKEKLKYIYLENAKRIFGICR